MENFAKPVNAVQKPAAVSKDEELLLLDVENAGDKMMRKNLLLKRFKKTRQLLKHYLSKIRKNLEIYLESLDCSSNRT